MTDDEPQPAQEPTQPALEPTPEPTPSQDPGPLATETEIRSVDPGHIQTATFAKGSGDFPRKPGG